VLSSVTPGAASRAYLAFVRDPPTHLRYSMQTVYILYRRDPYVNSDAIASNSHCRQDNAPPEVIFRSEKPGKPARCPIIHELGTCAGSVAGKANRIQAMSPHKAACRNGDGRLTVKHDYADDDLHTLVVGLLKAA